MNETTKELLGKIEKSMHSNDCMGLGKGKGQEDYEEEWGLAPIFKALKNHGWNRWQWHVYTKKDLKQHNYLTNFVEVFGDNYHGYLRGDSRTSLKDACEKVLNIAMRFNQCEMTKGHKFKVKKGYENGMLQCIHCGFWGYTNRFAILMSEKGHYEMHCDILQKQAATYPRIIAKFGLAFNSFGGLLIRESFSGKHHNFVSGEPTEKFLQDLRKVFIKHKLLDPDNEQDKLKKVLKRMSKGLKKKGKKNGKSIKSSRV